MASRDLTKAFLERRGAALKRRGGPSSNRLTAGGTDEGHSLSLMEEGDGIQLSTFGSNGGGNNSPPAWVQDVEAVQQCLLDIQRHMEDLQSMHASRLGSVFGRDLDDMELRIERTTRDITDRFRQAERRLKKVGAASRNNRNAMVVGANVQRSLAKQLQELSVAFRTSQRKYLAEVQTQKHGDLAVDSKFGIDLSSDEQGGDFFTSQQLQVVDNLQEAIQSRDQEISKIAQSIEELGTIFKELAVLVIDQGTILDRIDYNMEAVVEHTKTGISQLEKAEKAQKNSRPMKCIVCLVSLIFVLLFLLVLKFRLRKGRG